jgi:hypothetical protein
MMIKEFGKVCVHIHGHIYSSRSKAKTSSRLQPARVEWFGSFAIQAPRLHSYHVGYAPRERHSQPRATLLHHGNAPQSRYLGTAVSLSVVILEQVQALPMSSKVLLLVSGKKTNRVGTNKALKTPRMT